MKDGMQPQRYYFDLFEMITWDWKGHLEWEQDENLGWCLADTTVCHLQVAKPKPNQATTVGDLASISSSIWANSHFPLFFIEMALKFIWQRELNHSSDFTAVQKISIQMCRTALAWP